MSNCSFLIYWGFFQNFSSWVVFIHWRMRNCLVNHSWPWHDVWNLPVHVVLPKVTLLFFQSSHAHPFKSLLHGSELESELGLSTSQERSHQQFRQSGNRFFILELFPVDTLNQTLIVPREKKWGEGDFYWVKVGKSLLWWVWNCLCKTEQFFTGNRNSSGAPHLQQFSFPPVSHWKYFPCWKNWVMQMQH